MALSNVLQALLKRRLLLGLFIFSACAAGQYLSSDLPAKPDANLSAGSIEQEKSHVWMTVGEHRFALTLVDSEAAHAFAALLPLTLNMAELNGNEKHASLRQKLPTDANRPGTIRNGDIMLYGSDTLVVFYLTFSSPYSYTRLGHVDDPAGLAQALGARDVNVSFSRN